MKEVKNLKLPNGGTYTGSVESNGNIDIPSGVGICKYSDHNEFGFFQDGEIKGLAYINYHEWMHVGICEDNLINGWGIKVDKGKISFGIFEDNNLKINLTPLVDVFWNKIIEDTRVLGKSAISLQKDGEIFVGVPQYLCYEKFGFHFLTNGEVFLGQCEFGERKRTGQFLHFDLNGNITRGEYEDGELIRVIDNDEFIKTCGIFINHAYLDFDINKNYNPYSSFLFGEEPVLRIVEIGSTPNNLIVKANISDDLDDEEDDEKLGVNIDSIWFMFPNDDDLIKNELIGILNDSRPWVPNFDDYRVEFFNDFREALTSHQVVYKHVSCWDADAYFDLNMFEDDEEDYEEEDINDHPSTLYYLIPDFEEKKYLLENQWRENGWYYSYPSVRDYVKSLAFDDDVPNFFGWLFNNDSLNEMSASSLPSSYKTALEDFFNLFWDL